MIPIELKLKNFLSYSADCEPIRFDGFNIACLTGDNGNGKSALLDAITWAVWGQARGTDERGAGVDDLVNSGAEDMEVDFTFRLEGDTYRISRRRDKRRGKSSLEFQIADNGVFRSISGDNIAATQQKIIQVLRMDYHTFTSASFILQGKADTFTSMKPSERKKILGEILGLSIYRDLEAMAREESNRAGETVSRLDARLNEIDSELSEKEHYQQQQQKLQTLLQQLSEELDVRNAELNQLKNRLYELSQTERRVCELKQQVNEQQKQAKSLKERVQTLKQQIAHGEELLSRADEITAGYHTLQNLTEKDRVLNTKSRRLLELREKMSAIEQLVDKERAVLEKKYAQMQGEYNHYQEKAVQVDKISAQTVKLEKRLQELQQLEKQHKELLNVNQSIAQEIKTKEVLVKTKVQQVKELREKYSLLRKPTADCPLCRTKLTGSKREQVLNDMIAEANMLKAEQDKLQREISLLTDNNLQNELKIKQLETSIADLKQLERQYTLCQRDLEEAKNAADKLNEIKQNLDRLLTAIDNKHYAQEQQKQIVKIQSEINALNYNAAEHNQVQELISRHKEYENQYHRLQAASAALDNDKKNLQLFTENLQSLENALQNSAELIAQHNEKLAELPKTKNKVQTVETKISELQKQIADAERNLGILQEKLDRCQRLEQEKQTITAERNAAKNEKIYYSELVKAFGKNGIQAIIIENAIPELEQEANRILQQISDGRLTVALVTQKAAKTRKSVVETLEIIISDEFSTRRYEMYSGGEAFKVNFALRIALSRLLARRAGARLQTLVIDEGFGTQDQQGKERLVQAINAIADDFEKIIVITHIEELKNSFPVHLVVTKGNQGSKVEIRH